MVVVVYTDAHNLINKKRGGKQEERPKSRFDYETLKTAGAGTSV